MNVIIFKRINWNDITSYTLMVMVNVKMRKKFGRLNWFSICLTLWRNTLTKKTSLEDMSQDS